MVSGRAGGAVRGERGHDGFEQDEAVGAPEHRFAGALGVRHQPEDVPAALQMPAMPFMAPLGLASSVMWPRASRNGR